MQRVMTNQRNAATRPMAGLTGLLIHRSGSRYAPGDLCYRPLLNIQTGRECPKEITMR